MKRSEAEGEDVVILGMEAQGLAALKAEIWRTSSPASLTSEWTFEHIIAGGDRVGAWVVCGGIHSGELWGIPATGRTLAVREIAPVPDRGREGGRVPGALGRTGLRAATGTHRRTGVTTGAVKAETLAEDRSIRSEGSEHDQGRGNGARPGRAD